MVRPVNQAAAIPLQTEQSGGLLTYQFRVSLHQSIEIQGSRMDRESFLGWVWARFGSQGLLGIHEGTILSEEAETQGLTTDSWTVDSGPAPRSRDWIASQNQMSAEFYFETPEGARQAWEVLKTSHDLEISEIEKQAPRDWNAEWRASFLKSGAGISVPPFWRIFPPWIEEPRKASGEYALKINPGAGFGTGTHETTQLCLQALGEISKRKSLNNQNVLDFGSGSGILAIGASLLGARVHAVEIDPLAVENARDNSAFNQVETRIHYALNMEELPGPFDVILANILRTILLEFANPLVKRLASGGSLVLSGLIESDVEGVSDTYCALLGRSPRLEVQGEWRALIWEGER